MLIYPNLKAEMARKGFSQKDLAKALNMYEPGISYKMHSKSGFTVTEAIRVKKLLGVEMPLEVLFERAEV